jgi:hypothetical protein
MESIRLKGEPRFGPWGTVLATHADPASRSPETYGRGSAAPAGSSTTLASRTLWPTETAQ